jgi:polysaccharide biosynthesis protein PslG
MTIQHDPFGLLAFLHWNHDWNNFHFNEKNLQKAIDQLEELGIGFVRVDILWSDVDRGHLKYDFTRYDHLFSLLADKKINVLGVLQYNKTSPGSQDKTWNQPPDSIDEFASYVGATVDHYKQIIKHWEIWNEPNLGVYWAAPKDNLTLYSKLLTASFAAAKKADPTCIVLNGGLTEPLNEDVSNLYRQGGKNIHDILNIHTFIDPLSPDAENRFRKIITDIRSLMIAHGDADKKIWITEMGCPGIPGGREEQLWFAGKGTDENQQADWLKKQYALIREFPFIEKLFWAFYRDTENEFKDATDHLGLVRLDFTPKPAFFQMKKLIEENKKRN